MPDLLRMPEVSADATAAILSGWPLAERQPYAAGDVIVVIETAKAVVDVEAEAAGVLVKHLVAPGTDVRVGDPIALTARPDESVPDPEAALASLGVTSSTAGTVAEATPEETPTTVTATEATPTAVADRSPEQNGTGRRVFSSPLARRLAREADLVLASIAGSGPGGRILRRDVEQALTTRGARTEDTGSPAEVAPAPRAPRGVGTEVPHSRMRRLIAERLMESKRTIPHFYLRGIARVDALLGLRAELNENAETKITINDLVVKAVAGAHRAVPAANVIWGADAITELGDVDIAIAVATPTGLATPVLRRVDRLPIGAVAAAARELAERVRAGQVRQTELEGGSITVTNLGMYGTREFDAIINPPQSSILAVGAVTREPVVDGADVRVASVMRVSLSVDHRPIDGATAAQWMAAFVDLLEHPIRILV